MKSCIKISPGESSWSDTVSSSFKIGTIENIGKLLKLNEDIVSSFIEF